MKNILLTGLSISFLILTTHSHLSAQCNDSLEYGVVLPIPVTKTQKEDSAFYKASIDSIKTRLPYTNNLWVGFDGTMTDSTDWIKFLDICQGFNLKVIVQFIDSINSTTVEGLRPVFNTTSSQFDLLDLGEFVQCQTCITHPALHSVFMVDEPWHGSKPPFYTTDTLKMMYNQLKSMTTNNFKIMVAFSRMIWNKTWSGQGLGGQGNSPLVQWDYGMCDIAQISTLEFQQGQYWWAKLDSNHYYSRKIIDSLTPTIPLYTSVQVFGKELGSGQSNTGYWFPQPADIITMLDSITDTKYQNEYPLTGINFQQWDSPLLSGRVGQFSLGDVTFNGSPGVQTSASSSAIATINQWIAPCENTTGIQSEYPYSSQVLIYPNPFSTQTTLQTSLPLINATLTVDNCFGQTVAQKKNISGHTVALSRDNLPSGLYFIRLTQENKIIATDKFVIVGK